MWSLREKAFFQFSVDSKMFIINLEQAELSMASCSKWICDHAFHPTTANHHHQPNPSQQQAGNSTISSSHHEHWSMSKPRSTSSNGNTTTYLLPRQQQQAAALTLVNFMGLQPMVALDPLRQQRLAFNRLLLTSNEKRPIKTSISGTTGVVLYWRHLPGFFGWTMHGQFYYSLKLG